MLEIRNLSFHYEKQNQTLLKEISLNCPTQQLCYLVGENGSGKTTLLRLLAGLTSPKEGMIHLKEKPLSCEQTSILLAKNECSFPNLSGLETIQLFCTLNKTAFDRERGWFKILNQSKTFQRALSEQYASCSSGMRQLINIAITVTKEADLYLFDEPFTNLDEKNKNIVIELFEYLAQNQLVWFSGHVKSNEEVSLPYTKLISLNEMGLRYD